MVRGIVYKNGKIVAVTKATNEEILADKIARLNKRLKINKQ